MKKTLIKILAIVLVMTMVVPLAGCKSSDYKKAMEVYEAGAYAQAAEQFRALGDYKDSAAMATDSDYMMAISMFDCEEYEAAVLVFDELGDYKDSADYAVECRNMILEKAFLRTWTSSEVDMIDAFLEVVGSGNKVLELLGDSFSFGSFMVRLDLTAAEDGTFEITLSRDMLETAINGAIEKLTDALQKWLDDSVGGSAAAKLLYAIYKVDNMEDLAAAMLGMSFEEYIYQSMKVDSMMDKMNETVHYSGTYEIENGALTMYINDAPVEAVCDPEAQTLTVGSVSGDGSDVFPLTFTPAE